MAGRTIGVYSARDPYGRANKETGSRVDGAEWRLYLSLQMLSIFLDSLRKSAPHGREQCAIDHRYDVSRAGRNVTARWSFMRLFD